MEQVKSQLITLIQKYYFYEIFNRAGIKFIISPIFFHQGQNQSYVVFGCSRVQNGCRCYCSLEGSTWKQHLPTCTDRIMYHPNAFMIKASCGNIFACKCKSVDPYIKPVPVSHSFSRQGGSINITVCVEYNLKTCLFN